MAIQFISVKCPNCNANLSVEEGRSFAYCSYCGSKVMIHNENEHIYRNIDEAGIKQAETDRMVRMKELEMEEKMSSKGQISTYVAYGIALVFVIIGFMNFSSSSMTGLWGIMIGAYIAMFAYGGTGKRTPRGRSM